MVNDGLRWRWMRFSPTAILTKERKQYKIHNDYWIATENYITLEFMSRFFSYNLLWSFGFHPNVLGKKWRPRCIHVTSWHCYCLHGQITCVPRSLLVRTSTKFPLNTLHGVLPVLGHGWTRTKSFHKTPHSYTCRMFISAKQPSRFCLTFPT